MKAAIRYYSKGGNTEKVALAISKATGLPAETIDVPLLEDVDILFLGSSVYGFDVDVQVKQFISNIDVKVGKVVNFSTACLVKSTYKQVGKLLAEKNIPLAKEEYYCRGSFGPMHKGRPNQQDLQAAEAFARKIMEG
ncbi:MAG: flavodoxin family protein [Lachnospiraceae bacterium]|jgi:flavodoxin|nr:flavodoxin family protein [Lachnospiraceae bacterium]